MDFNPLDLLAAAAALQRDDPSAPSHDADPSHGGDPSCDEQNSDETSEEEDPNKSDKMGSARKVRSEIKRQNSCNLPSDLGKLFGGGPEMTHNSRSQGQRSRRHSWSSERVTDTETSDSNATAQKRDCGVVNSEPTGQFLISEANNSPASRDEAVASDDSSRDSPRETSDRGKTEGVDSISKSAGEDENNSGVDEHSDASKSPESEKWSDEDTSSEEAQTSAIPVCRLCQSPGKRKLGESDADTNVLCARCGRQTLSGEDVGASPADNSSMSGSASGVDSSTSEQCESSFVADNQKISEASEHPATSSLLETFLTTVQTGAGQSRYTAVECRLSGDDVYVTDCESSVGRGLASTVESDHSYASQPGKVVERQSADCYDTETGAESDSCDENSSAEDVEHRARSMSIESSCLRCGFDDKRMPLAVRAHDDDVSTEASLLSPTSSIDSSLTDFPSVRPAPLAVRESTPPQRVSLQGFTSSDGCDDSPTGSGDSFHGQIPSKIGKFRIGTFASFSSSDIKGGHANPPNGSRNLLLPVSKDHSSGSHGYFDRVLLGSPPPLGIQETPGMPSFLQSPCGDWDRSDAGSEVQDDVGPPLLGEDYTDTGEQCYSQFGCVDNFSVHHDHDYCLRGGLLPHEGRLDAPIAKPEKRKYNKTRVGRSVREPKLKSKVRIKIIKTEPLEPADAIECPALESPRSVDAIDFKQPFEVDFPHDKIPATIGRTSRRRLEKLQQVQEQLELDNGSKLKITGKFKDEYVYYLNKASRSRRRSSKELPPLTPSDKILIPAPKPGDIIVPHLTDADIEAIKLRGRAGLSISEKYYGAGLALALHSVQKTSTDDQPQAQQAPASENIADMDSNIISTILSMENDNLGSPSADSSALSDSVDLYTPAEDSMGINFLGENMALTPDQVNMLLDAVKDVDSTPEQVIDPSGTAKYNLDDNQNYDQSVDHFEVCSDQKSVDEASTSDNTERRQSVSSAASEIDTDSKDQSVVGETEDPDVIQSAEFNSKLVPGSGTSLEGASSPHPAAFHIAQARSGDSSPAKTLLEADLNTIGESGPLRDLIPTLEKPFDLLGNDFRLDKSDLFPEAAVMEQSSSTAATAATAATSLATAAADYNTPWIVTVTMFWNDLPAIMIDNQPFVRLVDIHKQILPAKDTGILKKRCQLLGIEVQNCTEMQRYFLVQYGRAYNSKSTLIVSKDNAKGLIGYYVTPQPRVARSEDAVRREEALLRHDGAGEGEGHQGKGPTARKKMRTKATHKIKIEKLEEPLTPLSVEGSSPDASPPVAIPGPVAVPVPDVKLEVKDASVPVPVPVQESKRLRHKKINYLDLLKGETTSDSVCEPIDVTTGESLKKSSSTSPVRRKAKLSDAEKLKLVKDELKKRKIELPDDSIRETKRARICERDSEEENNSSPTTRRRVSSTRLRNTKSGNGNKKSKLKVDHLKVKIKGLLNFKKDKKKGRAGATKIVEIRHKDPKPTNSHPSVTQDGDIHLDLYQKKNSLCVKCCSCLKFFSLRNFLTHQHYPDDTEILTTVAQPQVLEPRSVKFSERKKLLWQEFNTRRRQLEAPKLVSEPRSVVLSKPLNTVNKSVIPTSPSEPPQVAASRGPPPSVPQSVQPVYKPRPELEAELRKKIATPQFKQPVTVTSSRRRSANLDGVRVSLRKRKERQLFPIENYSYAKKARMELEVNGDVETGEVKVVAAVGLDSVLTLSNGPEITHYTALQED